jgi:exodeoxyribonuclease-1
MSSSFFFYDLETSGFSPRAARIMQFAGQRTDMSLKPVGEPVNFLIKLNPDVLPDPDAVLVTGITPQQTLADGLSEAEALKLFYQAVVRPETIFVGFNNIRFDDEFITFLNYRNFYDAYEWRWKDGCSRWDLLDVVRMTRALRPKGIEWAFAPDGKPSNRLEYLTKVNKLSHVNAHDALSDVNATIDVARLIRAKQQDLFDYLLDMRDKKKVAPLVLSGQPFVYTSGRYSSQWLHTTVAVLLAKHTERDEALVYGLRFDPTPFLDMTAEQIRAAWRFTKDPDALRLPVKTLKYNRCPAVAPLGVIKDKAVQQRLDLSLETVKKNLEILKKHHTEFAKTVSAAVARMDEERAGTQTGLVDDELVVDERLYDGGFFSKADASLMRAVRAAEPAKLPELGGQFHDSRLKTLLPLYQARNYPKSLSADQRARWEEFCRRKLLSGDNDSRLAQYMKRIEELSQNKLTKNQQYSLEELKLYGESLLSVE